MEIATAGAFLSLKAFSRTVAQEESDRFCFKAEPPDAMTPERRTTGIVTPSFLNFLGRNFFKNSLNLFLSNAGLGSFHFSAYLALVEVKFKPVL